MLRVYEHSFHTLTSRKKESLRVLRHSCYSASMSGPVLEKAMVDGGYRISREHLKIRTATTYAKRLMNVFRLLVVTRGHENTFDLSSQAYIGLPGLGFGARGIRVRAWI